MNAPLEPTHLMSDTPPEFDLKFLPSWLKEGPAAKNYADYEGGDEPDRRGGDRRGDRGDRRGPRPGGPGGRGPGGPGGRGPGGPGGRGPGGPRPGGPGGPRTGDFRGPRRDGGGGGGRGGDRRGGPQGRYEERAPAPPRPAPVPTAEVRVEFVPEPGGATNIAKQIKQSGRAYPLFGTGRLFLEMPERHRVRITSLDANLPLHQIGDGPISFDPSIAERNAFRNLRSEYYTEEVTQGEALKGNFANVARLRATGALVGPTNHHSYQPTLRRIYEERYSRRMSFPEFVQMEVEVRSDEQSINDWKEQARSVTTYVTTKEAEPITFKTAADAEQHFRKNYLPTLMKSGVTLECSGHASRALPDRSVSNAVRDTWEKERAFPAGLVNHLRPFLLDAGLHFFKHRKRILYISAIKPLRSTSAQPISTSLAAILTAIETTPKCARRQLATLLIGEKQETPEWIAQKDALARDLHYLIHMGNVIEFHDGSLDLPLVPGGAQPQGGQAKSAKGQPAAEAEEAGDEAEIAEIAAIASTAEAPVAASAAEPLEAAAVAHELVAADGADASLPGSGTLHESAAATSELPPPTHEPAAEAVVAAAPHAEFEHSAESISPIPVAAEPAFSQAAEAPAFSETAPAGDLHSHAADPVSAPIAMESAHVPEPAPIGGFEPQPAVEAFVQPAGEFAAPHVESPSGDVHAPASFASSEGFATSNALSEPHFTAPASDSALPPVGTLGHESLAPTPVSPEPVQTT